MAQIYKNTVNLFVKKHNEIFAAADDMPLIVNHFPVFIWEIPFFFKNLELRFQKLRIKNKSLHAKGQIKPKADWGTVDSPKKRTNEYLF